MLFVTFFFFFWSMILFVTRVLAIHDSSGRVFYFYF